MRSGVTGICQTHIQIGDRRNIISPGYLLVPEPTPRV